MVTPRNWFAEAIATYALVFFGPLAVILSVVAFGEGLSIEAIIMISLGHGGAIGLMVYAFSTETAELAVFFHDPPYPSRINNRGMLGELLLRESVLRKFCYAS